MSGKLLPPAGWPTRLGLFSLPTLFIPPDGHPTLPREWPVSFTTRLRSEQGAQERGVFPVPAVRRKIFLWSCSRGHEEQHADFFHRFTFDYVSQLDRDILTASVTTREWRNSFVRVNRIPLDVLSSIPTHLSSQKDRFRASFVCRHWRRTFLQHAVLWSQLYLRKGEVYTKTLLKRAKGSTLDITTRSTTPASTATLLPTHMAQIRYLNFEFSHWKDIQMFSEINPRLLPLLHTLRIHATREFNLDGSETMTPPSLPLFHSAVNLKELSLCSSHLPFLHHFTFPNLTMLDLSAGEEFHASQLFNFLEASPMLRTVDIRVTGILLEGVARETIVVLPNVETFSLAVDNGGTGYEIAARISCPFVKHTSLTRKMNNCDPIPQDIFPASVLWNTIVRQYTKSPVEEVALEIKFPDDPIITCSLTFRSTNADVLNLDFQVSPSDDEEEDDEYETRFPSDELHYEVFHQASRTIRDHPLLTNVKRLWISHRAPVFGTNQFPRFSDEVGQLFKFVGPLEELTTYACDLHLYSNPSPTPPGFYDVVRPVVFPPIRKLTISHPLLEGGHSIVLWLFPVPVLTFSPLADYERTRRNETYVATIVELARSQHTLGIPFERVTLRMKGLPPAMAGGLAPWVSAVDCYEEMMPDGDNYETYDSVSID